MRQRVPGVKACAGAVLMLTLAWNSAAQAPSPEPSPGRVVVAPATKRPSLTPRAEALRRLEEELSRVFKPFSPKPSLDGITPQYQPVRPAAVPTREALEDADRRKNWGMLTPDEVAGIEAAEKLFAPLDKPIDESLNRTRKRSAEEEFYLNYGRSGEADELGLKSEFGKKDSRFPSLDRKSDPDKDDDSKLPESVRNSRRKLEEMARPDADDNYFAKSAIKDMFRDFHDRTGLDKSFLTERDAEAHKAYMKEYRQLLAGPSPDSTVPGTTIAPAPNTAPTVGGLMPAYSSTPNSAIGSGFGAMNPNPVFRPSTPQEVNAQVLNRWNPTYASPRLDPPKPVVPPKPSFDAPRRKF